MIFKFQQGGTTGVPPLVSYDPVIYQDPNPRATTQSTEAVKESKDKGLLDEETEKLIDKLDGLPNDSALIIQMLESFELDKARGINTTSLTSKYFNILNLAKTAKTNKLEYDNAYKLLAENGGLNEIAIDNYGRLICVNAGGDYDYGIPGEIPEGYRPITNSELLEARAYSTGDAYNHNLLSLARNGIGIGTVNKMINEAIGTLGSTEISKEGYTAQQNGKIINGIQLIQQAIQTNVLNNGDYNTSIDGLYKNKVVSKDQALQMLNAVEYIYRVLPENAKTLLKVKSDNTDAGAIKLVTQLIASKTSTSKEFATDLQAGLNLDGSKKEDPKENKNEDKREYNPVQAFQQDLGVEVILPINAGTPDSLTLKTTMIPTELGIVTLDKVANESIFKGIFDFSQVTMGDQQVDMTSLQNISVNAGNLYKVYLPYNKEKAKLGITAPDVDAIAKLEVVRNKIQETNATTPEAINAIYEGEGLNPFVTPDGKINEKYYRPFGVMNATALSDAFKKKTNFSSLHFQSITDDNEIQNAWDVIKGINSKERFDEKGWFFNSLGIGGWQEMVKGLVYLPLISIDPTLGAYSAQETLTRQTLEENKQAMAAHQKSQVYNAPGQLQLP